MENCMRWERGRRRVLAVNEEQRELFFSTQRGMSPTPQTSLRLHENSWLLAGHSLAFFSAPAAYSFADVKSSSARCQASKPRVWGGSSVRGLGLPRKHAHPEAGAGPRIRLRSASLARGGLPRLRPT